MEFLFGFLLGYFVRSGYRTIEIRGTVTDVIISENQPATLVKFDSYPPVELNGIWNIFKRGKEYEIFYVPGRKHLSSVKIIND
jgi:hypothetical protein